MPLPRRANPHDNLTQDNIDKLIKLVHLEAEGAHQSIRRARTKGMDTIKKVFKNASQDEKKRQEKEVGVAGLVYTVSTAVQSKEECLDAGWPHKQLHCHSTLVRG